METRKSYEIHQTIELIREYLETLTVLEEQQTDIADKLPFASIKVDLLIAIKDLEYQLEKELVKLATSVRSSSEIKKLHTNYLPGSICYVLQDNDFYILDTNHEWVKV
jgi:hypothetical protein